MVAEQAAPATSEQAEPPTVAATQPDSPADLYLPAASAIRAEPPSTTAPGLIDPADVPVPEFPLLLLNILTGEMVVTAVEGWRNAWSPDSMRLAVVIRSQGIAIVSVETGLIEQVVPLAGSLRSQEFSWAPDGERLAVGGDRELLIVSLDGEILDRLRGRFPVPRWDREHSLLAFENQIPVGRIDVWDGTEVRSFPGYETAGWTDDGRLALVRQAGEEELAPLIDPIVVDRPVSEWVVAVLDPERDYAETARWRVPSFAPPRLSRDGEWIAYDLPNGRAGGGTGRDTIVRRISDGVDVFRHPSGLLAVGRTGAVADFSAAVGLFLLVDVCEPRERLVHWDGTDVVDVVELSAAAVLPGPEGLPIVVRPLGGPILALDEVGAAPRDLVPWPWEFLTRSPDGVWLAYGTQVGGRDHCP